MITTKNKRKKPVAADKDAIETSPEMMKRNAYNNNKNSTHLTNGRIPELNGVAI